MISPSSPPVCARNTRSAADFDLIVIGGGPAGMMAAGRATARGRRTLLLERGPALGRKLLITGGGRCNVTNSAPVADYLKAFGRHGAFLRDALTRFDGAAMSAWLRARGVETVEFRGGCVFPADQDARVVLRALGDELARSRAVVRLGERVRSLWIENGALRGVITERERYAAPHILIATGGLSYPTTGSTGDGYDLARQAGHTITPTFPALIGLETVEDWPRSLQGTPIKNTRFRVRAGGRLVTESFGEGLWTHYGLSGPAVLDLSRDAVSAVARGETVSLELDFRPTDSEDALDKRLLDAIKTSGKKLIRSVLAAFVAERTAAALADLAEIAPHTKMSQCSKAHRRRLVRVLKQCVIHVAGPRPIEEAIVTGGGVSLKEVDPKRMESRLLHGLHFAGEVLDLDGPCGGFNLQAAFATGYLVGETI